MFASRIHARIWYSLAIVALAFGSLARPSDVVAGVSDTDQSTGGIEVALQSGHTFTNWITEPPLASNKYWVLEGSRNGDPRNGDRCSYDYTLPEAPLEPSGWELRTVATDIDNCAKLIEEGIPAARPAVPSAMLTSQGDDLSVAASSNYSAWQQIIYKDAIFIPLTYDVTQIYWTSTGTSVTTGATDIVLYWKTSTGWVLDNYSRSGNLAVDHSFYKGNTTSEFHNSTFCWPLPTVWTEYYYNRMWGFPDGHATRSWSADSIDECLYFNLEVYSQYGQF